MDMKMDMKQVSNNCFAVLCEKNRVCDANPGFINSIQEVVKARGIEVDFLRV